MYAIKLLLSFFVLRLKHSTKYPPIIRYYILLYYCSGKNEFVLVYIFSETVYPCIFLQWNHLSHYIPTVG